jgi:Holliday junction resolvasome RuvABC endonuclease subunit
MSKVLAYDQSTRCSGWAIFDGGEYVESGVVDMSKSKLDTDERSFEMAKELWKIMRKYKPNDIILEDVQQQTSVSVVKILARLQGMLIGHAEAHGVKVHILLPSQWRKAIHFNQGPKVKRAELKQQSIDYVKEHYDLALTDDESDAICLGVAAHKIFDFDNLWGD